MRIVKVPAVWNILIWLRMGGGLVEEGQVLDNTCPKVSDILVLLHCVFNRCQGLITTIILGYLILISEFRGRKRGWGGEERGVLLILICFKSH